MISSNLPISWEETKGMAQVLIDSGYLPSHIKTPQQAAAIIQKGRELGIGPMQSFEKIYVVGGKAGIAAELQLSLIYKNHKDAIIDYKENSNERCEIEATRSGHKPQTFSFSMDDARLAGLAGGHSWKRYPRALLRSRAISEMARALFPDAIAGASYTPEELGAQVNEEGAVIDTQAYDYKISNEQRAYLFKLARENGLSDTYLKSLIKERFSVNSTKDLDREYYEEMCDLIKDKKDESQ